MKVSSIANALVLLVGTSCAGAAEDATPTLAECRSFCKEVRQGVLNDIDTCTPALPIGGGMKLFNACVGGRKKAFEQACVPTCAKAELSISSYEGCLNIAKGKGQKYADWCRKGYDGILQHLSSLLVENPVLPKQEEENEQESEEPVDSGESVKEESVKSEPELVKSEPTELESEPVKSESAKAEPAKSEPVKESEEEQAKSASDMTEEFQEGSTESKAPESEATGSDPDQSKPEVVESEMESANDEATPDDYAYVEQQRRASEVSAQDAGIRGGQASNKEVLDSEL